MEKLTPIELPEWFKDWLKERLPANIPFNCSGSSMVGIDFQTYAINSYPPAPLPPSGIKVTDDDHSGPAPTPLRIQIRGGYTALHCGYLLTIDTPPTGFVDLVYFGGGGIIDVFDPAMKPIISKFVPNSPSPTTETFHWSNKIGRIEIRSTNEMYLLQVCCR
jgi:hypothetical protein